MDVVKPQWLALAALIPFVMYYELKENKIYNVLTVPAIALGLLLGMLEGQPRFYLMGLVVGGGLFFFPYMVSGLTRPRPVIGGGDVKLAAAIGALMGMWFVLWTTYYAIFLGVGYWLVTLAWRLARRRKRAATPAEAGPPGEAGEDATPRIPVLLGRIPFGTAMCAGIFCVFWFRPHYVAGFQGW
jgi:prepilin signal peptidase PulO-like enzyme (type II secretory pathway)